MEEWKNEWLMCGSNCFVVLVSVFALVGVLGGVAQSVITEARGWECDNLLNHFSCEITRRGCKRNDLAHMGWA
jgi:hypothetical protein